MYISSHKKAENTLMMVVIISAVFFLCIFLKTIGKRMDNDVNWHIKQECIGQCFWDKHYKKCLRECIADYKKI